MRSRAVLAFIVLAAVLAALVVPAFGTANGGLAVTGFQEAGTSPGQIDASAHALTTVGVDGVTLQNGGASVEAVPPDAGAQLARAHADGLQAQLLVSNYSDRIQDFSEPLGHGLLGSPAHIASVAAALAADVRSRGWNGISIDLESLKARDTAGLTAFARALKADLPAGDAVAICIENFTVRSYYPANGYDLAALGAVVDRVELMAYDDHGPWENTPGPIGPLAWQKRGAELVMSAGVPAAKLDLGVAGYGYAWRPHANVQLSDAGARRLVASNHATANWNAAAGEWTATLPDGSVVWWSDARSYALRVTLAASLHLHGLAVWSLGLSDPLH